MITAKYHCYGFLVSSFDCWIAQVPQLQPADRDATDRAGSYDGNAPIVSAPRPPPTTINTIKAPHMPGAAQFVTIAESLRSNGICWWW
jgi:hypothetical protein